MATRVKPAVRCTSARAATPLYEASLAIAPGNLDPFDTHDRELLADEHGIHADVQWLDEADEDGAAQRLPEPTRASMARAFGQRFGHLAELDAPERAAAEPALDHIADDEEPWVGEGAGEESRTEADASEAPDGPASGPLPEALRMRMERAFGQRFDDVRIHRDSPVPAGQQAFSRGHDIHFSPDAAAPESPEGERILAHELAHVAQRDMPATAWQSRPPSIKALEVDAHQAALHALAGQAAAVRLAAPAGLALNYGEDAGPVDDNASGRRSTGRGTAPAGTAPALNRRDPAAFRALLEALDRIGEVRSSRRFALDVGGRTVQVTSEDILQLRQTAIRAIERAASRVRNSADGDLEGYRYQQQINRDSWIVAPIVHFVGGIRDPGPQLIARVREVQVAHDAVRAALSASRLADALRALIRAERASQQAHRLWREYHEGIISTGEGTVRALTFTRDASFITLGVLAIIATGGAATSTIAGIQVTTTTAATAISVGTPIVARVGEAGVRASLGEQVDWSRVAVDTVVDLVLVRLGGRLGQGLFQRLGGNPAVQRLGPDLARRVFSSVVMHEGATALRVIVDATYRRLRGQPITWEQFGEALLTHMTDPRGLFLAVAMGAVQTAADRRHGTPREFDVRDRHGRPVADIDEMRGGTLFEDKNARGLYRIPPGRSTPQQTEAEWAEGQIYDATVRRISGIPTRGVSTAQGRQPGSTRTVPELADVQAARRYVFRIELDNPALRAAVQAQLVRLRAQFPDWTFDAIFGYRPIRR